jgi:hypothetical protein
MYHYPVFHYVPPIELKIKIVHFQIYSYCLLARIIPRFILCTIQYLSLESFFLGLFDRFVQGTFFYQDFLFDFLNTIS